MYKTELNNEKMLNNIEMREMEIISIPVVKVESNDNGHEAPDGRVENVSNEMKHIEGIRDEKRKYTHYHEYTSHDETSCRDKRPAGDHGLVKKIERDKRGIMVVRIKG